MSTLFISDLHLEDGRPDIAGWLTEFLSGPARSADAVYILGDLFEFWIGDDALTAAARDVAKSTAELSTMGVPVFFIHGNRDFLLGKSYADQAGLRLLPEIVVTEFHGTPTLLLHGDTLCTDDVEYQAFRQLSRDPAWQESVLSMSIEKRLQLARSARDASMKHMGTASMDIMDVNDEAVISAFRRHGVTRMIHGHTHRPAFHRVDLGGGLEAERIVLADWYQAGSYLEVSATGAKSVIL